MAEKVDYQLTDAEGALLAAVTADAAAAAGALGGSIGGFVGGDLPGAFGGARGGASGGRLGSKATRAKTAQSRVEVDAGTDEVRARVIAAIEASGSRIPDPNEADDGSIWGIVGSGAMNMSPALVRVSIEELTRSRTAVEVRATGKEALIPQRIGAKAVDRIVAAVREPTLGSGVPPE